MQIDLAFTAAGAIIGYRVGMPDEVSWYAAIAGGIIGQKQLPINTQP